MQFALWQIAPAAFVDHPDAGCGRSARKCPPHSSIARPGAYADCEQLGVALAQNRDGFD
jgi:hypothetical protein